MPNIDEEMQSYGKDNKLTLEILKLTQYREEKPAKITDVQFHIFKKNKEDPDEVGEKQCYLWFGPYHFQLNKGHQRYLKSLWGPETDDWIGQTVTLYKSRTKARTGGTTDCIRIKGGEEFYTEDRLPADTPPAPPPAPSQAPAEPNEEGIPF